jgi:glutathione S-transferase
VPYRRSDRAVVAELTKQNRVPVLIDGEEIVHDSKRILQYLEHTRGGGDKPGDAVSTIDGDGNA